MHNTPLMTLHLIPALILSLALHAGLVVPDLLARRAALRPPPLQATLRLPPKAEPAPAETLLKNTIDAEPAPPAVAAPAAPPPAAPSKLRAAAKQAVRDVQRAQRKLSKELFYPPEAVARGLEGDVWLLLKLNDDGEILDVTIATSSGHAILDNAAIKAAYAMGRQEGARAKEIIVPAHFRLVP